MYSLQNLIGDLDVFGKISLEELKYFYVIYPSIDCTTCLID